MMSLEDQIEQLNVEIRRLSADRDRLHRQLLEKVSPFKEGDIITWREYKGRVVYIFGEPRFLSWKVVRIKKDGTEGRSTTVYYFDKPQKVNP